MLQTKTSNTSLLATKQFGLYTLKLSNMSSVEKLDRCFDGNITGWGWDTVMCAASHILGMPVIRDDNHHIEHPKSTNYDLQQAFDEYDELKTKLPEEIQWYIHHTITTGKRFLFKKYFDQ